MQQKLEAAEAKLHGKEPPKSESGKKTPGREGKGKKGKKKQEDTEDILKKREELKEAKRLEKQVRDKLYTCKYCKILYPRTFPACTVHKFCILDADVSRDLVEL